MQSSSFFQSMKVSGLHGKYGLWPGKGMDFTPPELTLACFHCATYQTCSANNFTHWISTDVRETPEMRTNPCTETHNVKYCWDGVNPVPYPLSYQALTSSYIIFPDCSFLQHYAEHTFSTCKFLSYRLHLLFSWEHQSEHQFVIPPQRRSPCWHH